MKILGHKTRERMLKLAAFGEVLLLLQNRDEFGAWLW